MLRYMVCTEDKIQEEMLLTAASTSNNVFVLPNNTDKVETTLSFAINPAIKDVQIRQSPKPSGAKTGAIKPATAARMLFWESETIAKCKSNVCKNQITRDAIKITVNALEGNLCFIPHQLEYIFAPGRR